MAELSDRVLQFANKVAGDSCRFIHGTKDSPFSGGECHIFALESSTSKLAVRVEQHSSSMTRVKVKREIQLLDAVRKNQIPHLPSLIAFDLESVPPLIATSWAEGHVLRWCDSSPPSDIRKSILRTIAEVSLDMLGIQESGCPALSWITDKIMRTRINPSKRGQLRGVTVEDAEALRLHIADFHLPSLDDAPHVLIHGDLHASNIIVSEQQVESVIDLGSSTMVPLQFAPLYPRFLTNEPQAVGDTYDWSRCAYSAVQKEDRSFYLQCIVDMAPSKGKHAMAYDEILGSKDQNERHWWLSAISRGDMMRALKTRESFSLAAGWNIL